MVVKSKLARNIAGNWLGIGADAVTGFILTRVILHSVGNASYGLWVVLSGLLGYYGLLDLGTRNAVIRYVARFNAQKDYDNLSRVISTALATYLCAGAAVLLIAGVAAWKLNGLLLITDPAELHDGRLLILVLGLGAAIGFPLSAFGGALEGMQQFVRIGVVQAVASVGRAITVLVFLHLGFGIVAVGIITVAFNLAAALVNAVFLWRHFPMVRFAVSYVRRDTLMLLAGFGVVTFWIGIANRLRFDSDSFVIGKLLGLELVAIFAIASKVLAYGTEVVAAMSSVFTPLLSHADAVGDKELVRSGTLRANYYAALLALPIGAALLLFGKLLIELWVGAEYRSSYPLLAILVVPMTLYVSQGGTSRMMYAVGAHKLLARIVFYEALANLALSIALAHRFGLTGVAWGTSIPLFITSMIALPWCAKRLLGIGFVEYWKSSCVRALLLTTPTLILWIAFRWLAPAANLGVSLAILGLGGGLYAAMTFRQFSNARYRPAVAD